MASQNESRSVNIYINGDQADQTLKQIQSSSKKLRNELGQLVPGTQAFIDKSKELREVNDHLDAIKEDVKGVEGAMEGLQTVLESLGVVMTAGAAVEFGKELFELETRADGVHNAFVKIGETEGYLEKLRVASKGLIDDLDLEKIATKANNANIPIQQMGLFLKFAQQRAEETGESVTDLTYKLVEGLGKGTPKALSGLGVNVAEVKREFKETGDMVQAVANIINKEMNQAGDDVENFGERVETTKTKWENVKDKAAGWFKKIFAPDLADTDNIEKLTTRELKQFDGYQKLKDDQLNTAIQKQVARDQKFKAAYLKAQQELEAAQDAANKKGGDVYTDVSAQESKVKGLAEQYQAVTNALSVLNKEREKRGAKASDGSIEAIDQEITRLRSLQSQLSSTSTEYKKYEDLIKVQENKKAAITGVKKDDPEIKKLAEYNRILEDTRLQTALLAEQARKGTVDDLDAQLEVIRAKYGKVVAEINKLLKDPHTTDAIRKTLMNRLNVLGSDEKLDERNTSAAFKRAEEEKAKKENDDRVKAASGQIDNVYGSAKSDLDNQENKDLNNVKAANPQTAEQLRLNIQDQYAKKQYDLEQQHLQDMKDLYTAYGKDTAALDKKIADNTVKENERAAKKKEEDAKKYVEAKKQIDNMEMDNLAAGATLLESLLNKKSDLYKAALIVEKAVAVGRVIVNTNQSIAAFAAANAGIPLVGEGLIAAYTTQAYIQEGIEIASIVAATAQALSSGGSSSSSKPGYADGGYTAVDYTKPSGFVRRPTLFANSSSGRQFFAGEGYKSEYVVSSEQLKDPVVADFVSTMEAHRGVKRFENGGYTTQANKGAATSASRNPVSSSADLSPIVEGLNKIHAAIQTQEVTLNYHYFKRENDKNVQISNNSRA
ncbi:MAG TPA: hypothetical protein VGM41_10265 [Chitinophagaceae bacterium]